MSSTLFILLDSWIRMKSVGNVLLLVLVLWARINAGYYILVTNHAGNYNVSTSLPAWQRLDASNAPAFIVADDITVPIQLTRCNETVIDVTLLIARGTIPSEPVNATFWIMPNSVVTSGGRFNASLAVATQSFTAPTEGSWTRDGAVRTWTDGAQEFYVVTPRFRITDVALRGNNTYWIAMLIGQERRISPVDSTFNTPRWLLTGTPSSPLGSAAPLRGIDLNGTMFRAFPYLATWSNATAVETAALPFLTHTGTASLTHQMSFTAYVGDCYAPANVVIPSTRNFTTLPSPTAYATPTPPISLAWPSPIKSTPIKSTPIKGTVPSPVKRPVPSPHVAPPAPPVTTEPSLDTVPLSAPIEESSPYWTPATVPVEQTNVPTPAGPPPQWTPSESPVGAIHTISTSVLTDPFSSSGFIALLVGVIVLVIVVSVAVFMLASRRYRTRIANETRYNEVYDATKEVELTDDSVQLSPDNSSSGDSGEFQSRTFNGTLNATDLELQSDADMMVAVPVDPSPSIKRGKGQ